MTTADEPLLDVRGLTVRYDRGHGRRRAPFTALRDVDLTVAEGETLSVVGESGSGKTTLGNAVLGLVRPATGTIRFAGEDITHAGTRRRRELTRDIQVVFQHPHASLNPVRTIGQTLEEPLLAHGGPSRAERRAAVTAALERVRLDGDAAAHHPSRFSGGQLQRVAIARALMLSPRLLICDEAVSALDLSIQAQILNLLRDLQDDLGLSYLFISHDLAVVRHVSRRVAVLYRGRLMETGTVTEVCEHPRHPYTRTLLAAVPIPDPSARTRRPGVPPPADVPAPGGVPASGGVPAPGGVPASGGEGCPFRPRCMYAHDLCAGPLPVHPTPTGIVACHRHQDLPDTDLHLPTPGARATSASTRAGP
jgi:oligopeptide/dipeptide ABC transporter ATP-binding protein